MSYYKQKEKITLKIVPHTQKDIFTLRLSKKFIKVGLIFALSFLLILLGGLYYYYYRYNTALKEVNQLTTYRKQNTKLKQKNNYLHQKLSELSQKTEKIKAEFYKIKNQNQKIKKLINYNGKISSKVEYNSNPIQAIGAYDYNGSSKQIAKHTETNLEMLEKILPKKKKDLVKLKKDVLEYKNYLAAKPKGWPIKGGKGEITSTFGYRFHPVLKKRVFHDGLDIGVWYNHKIIATGKGKVTFAGWKSGYGRMIIINHGYGYQTFYGHNNRLLVRAGEYVKRGQVIALSGNSGRSTGPHLHYEIRYRRKSVDPGKYIK